MKYSRRDFIRIGGLAIGSGPLFAGTAFGHQLRGTAARQGIETFRQFIGSEFTFYRTDSAISGLLTEVKSFDNFGKKSSGKSFSLVFEMPQKGFDQKTYDVFHPSIGKFELFVVPGTNAKGVPILVAVINSI